jgi:hypothetical protein
MATLLATFTSMTVTMLFMRVMLFIMAMLFTIITMREEDTVDRYFIIVKHPEGR